MIAATAGHIDHGKTSLVSASDHGIDPDHFRLVRNLGGQAETALLAASASVVVNGPARRPGFTRAHFDAAGFTTRIHEGRRLSGNRHAIFAVEDTAS